MGKTNSSSTNAQKVRNAGGRGMLGKNSVLMLLLLSSGSHKTRNKIVHKSIRHLWWPAESEEE